MEICGGQTHAIVKFGLDELLPENITLVHGPGCPVCVTSAELIDQAVELALDHGVILCSFGDMLRVPGNTIDLLTAKARGGDVRIVYSPLDAVAIARENPEKQVVFFAVGFETTAPANGMAVLQAEHDGVKNFSILTSHVLVPPAMRAILGAPDNRVQGFLAAGHVCTIMGTEEYGPIAREFGAPIIITGFEPVDILEGIHLCVKQLEEGRAEVENAYSRAVKTEGNLHARRIVEQVFEITDRDWRGIGVIPDSGLSVRAGLCRLRCQPAFHPEIRPTNNGARMHQRRDHARCEETARLPGLRHALPARASARRADGFERGRLRRLLPLSQPRWLPVTRFRKPWHPGASSGRNVSCSAPSSSRPAAFLFRSRPTA